MAVPEGYTEVGLIGLVNKGNYDPLTEYSKYNFVYYQGSTYLYINELPQSGVTPSDDGVTWQYMSRGMMMDNTPTQGSLNAVTSGGIYDSERALKTEIQNEQTAATTKATDTNNVLGQGTVTNATNVQALLDNVTDKDTNPTKDSAKTVTSGGVYSADKATREMIAPVEENAVSSAAYAIGEQLIFNGVLCEATSAISIGDTLAMGTNLSTANKITNRDSTPTANSTKLVTSGGVYSADNQIRENIANVEGAISAHPYTVGKQLIFNGLLCKVTSAIAVGDTLAVGTNLALSDNVVEQIYSLNQGLTNSLADMNNVLGAKNFINVTSTTSTYNGLTFTINADNSVTVNGTATVRSYFTLSNEIAWDLKAGNYIINGCPSGGSASTFELQIRTDESDSSLWIFGIDYGNGANFNIASDKKVKAYIGVQSGVTVTNKTFYPMLRPASIQDDTYVPYAMTNREMTPYVQSISNPNLLDNPWFTVNQREFTTTTSSWVYISDRWMTGNTVTGSITKESDGTLTITGNSQIEELIEESRMEVGKTYTYSVMLYDNSIISETFVLPARTSSSWQQFVRKSINSLAIIGAYNGSNISFWIEVEGSATKRIKATKLELGSVSTLSMDSAPNYAEELLKCQRYFVRIKKNGQWGANIIGSLFVDGIIFDLNLASTMRANPTMSVISYGTIHTPSNDYVPTAIHVDNLIGNIVRFFASKPGWSFTNHTIANYEGVEFDLSADL